MAGALNYNRYPRFDMSEIIHELEFGFKSKQALKPLRKGDSVPNFIFEKNNFRWQQFINGVEKHSTVQLLHLLNKPLVIAFYSSQWQLHSLNMLKQLDELQFRIKSANANLLVVSSEREKQLEKTVWDNCLSLSFYFDTEKLIAEKFGIYSETDPVWDKFSGVDTNIPLLATYVISSQGKILFDHVDWDFSEGLPTDELISSIIGSRTTK